MRKQTNATKKMLISINPELHKALKMTAAKGDTTMTRIITVAIENQLNTMINTMNL